MITTCLKRVDNVQQTNFVVSISDDDWKPSWNLRPLWKIKLFFTNSVKFPTTKNLYLEVNIVNL